MQVGIDESKSSLAKILNKLSANIVKLEFELYSNQEA
jgi:hypothetical protein